MFKAIIVDDEISAGEFVQMLVSSLTDEIKICGISGNVKDAVHDIYKYMPDIIFLDIELADGSGFDILERFPDLRARVVFITAYEHYALKAIKHNAFEYLLKPVNRDELKAVLEKVIANINESLPFPDTKALLWHFKNNQRQKIAVPQRNSLQYYFVDEIILIEGEGSYSKIHLADGRSVLVTKIIKDFESALSDKGFLRIHKSFLVNISHITELHREDNGYVRMSNGKRIAISPRDKEDIIYRLRAQSVIV